MKLNTKTKEYRLLCNDEVIKTWKERPGIFDLSEYVSEKLVRGLHVEANKEERLVILNEKEREFLRWTCTELPYKDIAEKMRLSARTVDDYRQTLFIKLKVHSRIGLVIYAIKSGIVEV